MIHNTAINIEEWNRQRNIYVDTEKHTVLQIGFSTFFLNCCNISGIINSGPIGGSEQKGKYKIDARFNKDNLIKEIQKVASPTYSYGHMFLNIDPLYVKKGLCYCFLKT